ncbi:transmembrane protein [Ceratobasidium sp. AG-Ba]|nr:transmembrane protein [Ceratobasidium sp. AG-Ba]
MSYNVTADNISPLITYYGQWSDEFDFSGDPWASLYLNRTFHVSKTRGDQARFRFNGTAVYIFGAKRGNHGNYIVQIDTDAPEEYNGGAPVNTNGQDGVFRAPIYARENLSNELHTVTLTNDGEANHPYVDIDFVTWTVFEPSYSIRRVDDGDEFVYSSSEWNKTSDFVKDYWGQTEHVTNHGGASATLEFNGTGISLYGGTSPSHGNYTIRIDDQWPVTFNGSSGYHVGVLLYHANGLGPGTHTLKVTNTEDGKLFDIDYADIIQPATYFNPDLASIYTSDPVHKFSAVEIFGIVCGILVTTLLATIATRYYMIRRKRHSKFVDLVDEGIKPYANVPPVGYGHWAGGPGWSLPSVESPPLIVPRQPIRFSSNLAALHPHASTTIPAIPRKCRPVAVQAPRMKTNRRDEVIPRGTRTQVPSHAQDWYTETGTTESATTDFLPPDYRQVRDSATFVDHKN